MAAHNKLDPDTTVVAEWREDEPGREYGVFVSPEKRVFQFVINWGKGPVEEAVFAEWTELTDNYRSLPWGSLINRAVNRAPLDEKEPWEGMFTEG